MEPLQRKIYPYSKYITVSKVGLVLESSHGTIVPRKKEEVGGVRRHLGELRGTIVPLG